VTPKIDLGSLKSNFWKAGQIAPRESCIVIDIRNVNEQNRDASKWLIICQIPFPDFRQAISDVRRSSEQF